MKSSFVIRNAIKEYKENELIFASKLYKEKLSECISELSYYKMLERMCKNGELAKIGKGIYYIPKLTRYGMVAPSENQIIHTFTKNDSGMIIGYKMYNDLNLTTQVSKTIDVLSSDLDNLSKTLKNVKIKQVDIDFTYETKNMITTLEVLQNYYKIQDLNHASFVEYTKKFIQTYKDQTFEIVVSKINYKKSTISFLKEILNYYQIPNNLDSHLSTLSTYKHPTMEEIYELAQESY